MIKITFYVVAVVCMVAALVFFVRAQTARRNYQKGLFGVLRQAERQNMLVRAFSGVGLLLLALVFVGLGWFVGWWGSTAAVAETTDPTLTPLATVVETPTEATPLVVTATFTPEPTITVTPAVTVTATLAPPPPLLPTIDGSAATVTATVTVTSLQPTLAPSPTTSTPVAVVNSPVVGLYLRTGPGGEIIERLEDQVAVGLLGEEQNVDGLRWVKVKSPTGNEGWVAADYLNFNP